MAGPRHGDVRWTRKLEGAVTPGAVVGPDGTIYAASNGGVLHALDPRSGADRWSFDGGGSYGSDLSTAPAVLSDGSVLWPGPHDTLFALDAAGRLRWQRRFESFVLSPLVGAGGRLYIMEMNGRLHAFDLLADGLRERWVSSLGTHDTSFGSPALGDDGTIYTTIGNRIVALRDDGRHATILWHFDIHSGTEVSPAVSREGVAVFGTNDAFEYGLGRDGRVRWRYPRNSLSYSSPVVTADGLAYFGDHNGFMNVVHAADGSLVARYQGGDEVWTAAAVDRDRNAYFGTKGGHVLGYSFAGTKLFDVDTGGTVDSYPALTADGTLLVGSASGTLYAIHG
ncbi:MAG TPA: PQQ-binding-like beta-propeller repeat protein [Dehalococcoidia bacterium]|nr:PQQ-binding-like beta-propeller repeat protein [Dehalococcoidia bacterium]